MIGAEGKRGVNEGNRGEKVRRSVADAPERGK